MSKAEEYYRKLANINDRPLTLPEKALVKNLEYYHQSRVNDVSENDSKNGYNKAKIMKTGGDAGWVQDAYFKGFEDCKQLLKQ